MVAPIYSGRFKPTEHKDAQAPSSARWATDESVDRDRRPVIGVCGSNHKSRSVIAMMTQLRSAGAEPVFIGDHSERIKGGLEAAVDKDLARLDSLVVMGNDGDIDPAKYGQNAHPKTNIEADVGRAQYEELAIQKAMEMKLPLLAICGGMQRINILGGGTLHQDIPSMPGHEGDNHHDQGRLVAPYVPVQFVKVEDGTTLRDISGSLPGLFTPQHSPLPSGVVMENSFHHQAIDSLRDDFRVNARSDDGIVEGIEPKKGSRYGEQFILGVQWHPEFGASDMGAKIAMRLSQEARNYAKAQGRGAEGAPVGLMGELPYAGSRATSVLAARSPARGEQPSPDSPAIFLPN